MNNSISKDDAIRPPLVTLSPPYKKLYYQICEYLQTKNGFEPFDTILVSQLCECLSIWSFYAKKLKKSGGYVEYYDRGSNVSGDFTAMNTALKTTLNILPRLGIGLKDRQTIQQFINQVNLNQDIPDPWKERAERIDIG